MKRRTNARKLPPQGQTPEKVATDSGPDAAKLELPDFINQIFREQKRKASLESLPELAPPDAPSAERTSGRNKKKETYGLFHRFLNPRG